MGALFTESMQVGMHPDADNGPRRSVCIREGVLGFPAREKISKFPRRASVSGGVALLGVGAKTLSIGCLNEESGSGSETEIIQPYCDRSPSLSLELEHVLPRALPSAYGVGVGRLNTNAESVREREEY
eukprot:2039096-Amphidinium_carterae.1